MLLKNIFVAFLFCAAFLPMLAAGEFRTILGGDNKTIEEGYTFDTTYSHWAFLNPSLHAGHVTTGDFSIMTRSDIHGQHTLDENEAKIRIFFKPYIRVRTTARRSSNVPGNDNWQVNKLADGVCYERVFSRDSNQVKAIVSVKLIPNKAYVICDAVLENTGKRACSVEYSPEFTFLRNDVQPLDLTLRRQRVRYENGVRSNFWSNETTVLDQRFTNSFWWRRVAPNAEFSRSVNREIIPFTHEKLPAPNLFGFSNLMGKTTLVWDLAQAPKIVGLDIGWDAGHADAVPNWKMVLEPGEKKQIAFRLLTVKGLQHFDDVGEDWVFGYNPEGDLLQVQAAPLQNQDRLSVTVTVNDARSNQVVISQRSEVAAMTPFTPGRVDIRASIPFQPNNSYPVKLLLNSLADNSKILEISGNLVP